MSGLNVHMDAYTYIYFQTVHILYVLKHLGILRTYVCSAYVNIHMYIQYVRTYVNIRTYVHMVCTCEHAYICTNSMTLYVCEHTYVRMYVHTYVHTYVYV